jgi:hypothetical protein
MCRRVCGVDEMSVSGGVSMGWGVGLVSRGHLGEGLNSSV